jgi:hypothetical protein
LYVNLEQIEKEHGGENQCEDVVTNHKKKRWKGIFKVKEGMHGVEAKKKA